MKGEKLQNICHSGLLIMGTTRHLRIHLENANLEPYRNGYRENMRWLGNLAIWSISWVCPCLVVYHCLLYCLSTYSIFNSFSHAAFSSWVHHWYLHLYNALLLLSHAYRWSLLGWTESIHVLQQSHFSDNRLVVMRDWVGKSSGGERSNMGRIRRGWLVCDLYSDVGMNLTAFCSHRLSVLPPPCFPMQETSWSRIVVSFRSRIPRTSWTNMGDLVSNFISANKMSVIQY